LTSRTACTIRFGKGCSVGNNNAGQGVTDVALGARIYQNALRQGKGLPLELDGAQARDADLLRTMGR
jgi:hypothetical protein